MSTNLDVQNQAIVKNTAWQEPAQREFGIVGSMVNGLVTALRIDLPGREDGLVMKTARLVAAFVLSVIGVISVVGLPLVFMAFREVVVQRREESEKASFEFNKTVSGELVQEAHKEALQPIVNVANGSTFVFNDKMRNNAKQLGIVDLKYADDAKPTDKEIDEVDAALTQAVRKDPSLLDKLGASYAILPSDVAIAMNEQIKQQQARIMLLETPKVDNRWFWQRWWG